MYNPIFPSWWVRFTYDIVAGESLTLYWYDYYAGGQQIPPELQIDRYLIYYGPQGTSPWGEYPPLIHCYKCEGTELVEKDFWMECGSTWSQEPPDCNLSPPPPENKYIIPILAIGGITVGVLAYLILKKKK